RCGSARPRCRIAAHLRIHHWFAWPSSFLPPGTRPFCSCGSGRKSASHLCWKCSRSLFLPHFRTQKRFTLLLEMLLASAARRPGSCVPPQPIPVPPARLVEGAHGRRHLAPLADHVETKRTGKRNRFGQPHTDVVAEPEAHAGLFSRQRLMRLVVDIVIVSYAGYRHETVRAIVGQSDKKSRFGDARNAAVELLADAAGQMMGDQPVDGLPFGRHRAPLE